MSRILPIILLGIIIATLSFLPQTSAQSSQQATGLFHLVLLKKLLLAQQSPTPQQRIPTKQAETKVLGISQTENHTAAIIQEINDYRETQGLSPVQISDETCDFAKIRAEEISHSFTHDGFQKRITEKSLPYTSWTKATENIAMTTNAKEVVTLWINSPGHAENMKANTPFVCVEQYGNYFAYEGMRP